MLTRVSITTNIGLTQGWQDSAAWHFGCKLQLPVSFDGVRDTSRFVIYQDAAPGANILGCPLYAKHFAIDSSGNSSISSLKGSPIVMEEGYICLYVDGITSLEGMPLYVSGGNSIEIHGASITDLKGMPIYVEGNVSIFCSTLTSLEGMPKYIGGTFFLPRFFINKLIDDGVFDGLGGPGGWNTYYLSVIKGAIMSAYDCHIGNLYLYG